MQENLLALKSIDETLRLRRESEERRKRFLKAASELITHLDKLNLRLIILDILESQGMRKHASMWVGTVLQCSPGHAEAQSRLLV